MITWIMGILLIASFACFVIYAMRGGNLTIGFFILTIVWTLVYFLGIPFGVGEPFDVIKETFAEPALTYGPTIVQIVCGAWFGRVPVDDGHRRLDLLPHCQGRREEPGAGHHLRGIRHLPDLHQRLRRRLGHRHRRDPLPDHGPPRRAQARGRPRLHPVHRRRHVDQQRDVRAVRRLLPGL